MSDNRNLSAYDKKSQNPVLKHIEWY